ncbi:NDP-sugar synthase [Kitasatospora sp. NPDC092286]|uniref:nucleotidyltransferase family protein n=1 Tax=Kitasatospora sp. NPDC092286 TaxID=3364087 RepID=UPI003807F35A
MNSIVVLCGGRGSRMGPAGAHRQKTMSDLFGAPLLEHVLAQLCAAVPGAATIRLLAGYRAEDIEAAVPDWCTRIDPRIHAVREHTPGPAGLLAAAAFLPAPVLVVSGNVLLPYRQLLPDLLERHAADGWPVVAASANWRTDGHHTVNAHQGRVSSWHRAPHRGPGRYELVDTYLLTPEVFTVMAAGPHPVSHTRALEALHREHGGVAFAEHPGDWLHLQTPADLAVHPDRKDTLCPL